VTMRIPPPFRMIGLCGLGADAPSYTRPSLRDFSVSPRAAEGHQVVSLPLRGVREGIGWIRAASDRRAARSTTRMAFSSAA
jgi:hypothetical protein